MFNMFKEIASYRLASYISLIYFDKGILSEISGTVVGRKFYGKYINLSWMVNN